MTERASTRKAKGKRRPLLKLLLTLLLLVPLLALVASFLEPEKTRRYKVDFIQGLDPSSSILGVNATALNNRGQVTGRSSTSAGETHGFIWSVTDGSREIGIDEMHYTQPQGINDRGEVVGFTRTWTSPQSRAFKWTESERAVLLPTLGGEASEAHSINDKGVAVGWSVSVEGATRACLWSASGEVRDLGTPWDHSWAADVNDHGTIVGSYTIEGSKHRAFIWTEEEGHSEIGSIEDWDVYARRVNNQGTVLIEGQQFAGWEPLRRTFLWTREKGLSELKPTDDTGFGGQALNNMGHVFATRRLMGAQKAAHSVGLSAALGLTDCADALYPNLHSSVFLNTMGFLCAQFSNSALYENGQWVYLNRTVEFVGDPPLFDISVAIDLNDAGQLLGRSEDSQTVGVFEAAVLLTPID